MLNRLHRVKSLLMINFFRFSFSIFLFFSFISYSFASGDETPPNSDRSGGASNESFQTNLFTGSFSKSIPIVVPPGTGGMQPSLALSYDSGSINSPTILGAGWSLTGLGSIERSTKKGIPSYDGFPPNGSDSYILNLGSTYDLVTVSGDTNSPYHTKTETFLRIAYTSMTHPTGNFSTVYWTVTDKKGMQYRFGYNGDSNAIALNADSTTKNETRAWYLDKVTDTHGNYMEITYTQDATLGAVYPSKITYTKNSASPLSLFRTVELGYESRTDIVPDFRSGALVSINQRLKTIDVKLNGTLVKEYSITYRMSRISSRSLLQAVQEIGADSTSKLPATNFTYQENTAGWTKNTPWGNSIPDFILKSGGFNGVQIVDINGDGLPDFIKSTSASGTPDHEVWLNNGQTWVSSSSWAATIPVSFIDANGNDNGVRLVDVNGDGKPDFIQAKSGLATAVWLNNGSGWSASADPTWSAFPVNFLGRPVAGNTTFYDQGVQVVDINGDGLPDIVQNLSVETWQVGLCQIVNQICTGPNAGPPAFQSATVTKGVWINTGSGWTPSSSWGSRLPSDPLMRILITESVSNCTPSQIDSQGIPHQCDPYYGFGTTVQPEDTWTRFLDINGDGLLDVLTGYATSTGTLIKCPERYLSGQVPPALEF